MTALYDRAESPKLSLPEVVYLEEGYFKGNPSVFDAASSPPLSTPQKIVYVKVGDEEQVFSIHKDLACFHSPYFRAAFNGGFREGTTGEVLLDNVDPKIFGLFVDWLYKGDIRESICNDKTLKPLERHSLELPTIEQCIRLWVLAEYLQIPRLQNQCIKLIYRKRVRTNTVAVAQNHLLYEITPTDSPLRKFFVDMVGWSDIIPEKLFENADKFPPEMVLDLLIVERERRMRLVSSPLTTLTKYLVEENT